MKRTILFYLLLLSSGMLMAQSKFITGRIVDDEGSPVAFANVVLKNNGTDKQLGGTTTDTLGVFSIECGEASYTLVVSCVGYERLNVRCEAGDLGTLTVSARQLKEVSITADRITEEIDRYVVLPKPQEAEAAGRTLVLLDMLKLPGLRVDVALQRVTVDGGVAVLQINGKEVPITRLANLKAEQVKRIEYSNTPGARYLDRGVSGIINIILKEREDGGSIMAGATTAFTTGFVNSEIQGTYHKGKSEFMLDYSLSYRNYKRDPSIDTDNYFDPTRTVKRILKEDLPFWYLTSDITAEYTYQHDDSTMFVASVQDEFYTKTLWGVGTMAETDRGTTTNQTTEHYNYQKGNMPDIDLFYIHKLPKKQKVELNVVGTYSMDDWENKMTYTNISYSHINNSHGYAISGEGVYSKQFEKVELRTGLQYQHNFAENEYKLYDTTTSMYKDNAYLYAEILGAIGSKASYSIGTGAKLLNVAGGEGSQQYLRNLSTARLQWRICDQLSLTASAQYTPSLPSLSQLSPIFQQTDEVEGQIGNPSLKPSEQLNGRLMLRYTHPQRWYATAGGGQMRQFHPIVSTYAYDPTHDLFVRTTQNADSWDCLYAFGEVGTNGLWNCINLSLSGTYAHYASEGTGFAHTMNNLTASVNAQLYWKNLVAGANFTLLPQWSLYGEEQTLSETAQTIYVQYRWRSLQAMLGWLCPFNPNGYRYETVGLSNVHSYRHTNWTICNSNMVMLTLFWQMDFGKGYQKGEKTLHNGGYDNGMVK